VKDVSRYAVVRLWLSDRPGSLGQIASMVGEIGADLVGIDILERDGARAVDELTLELPAGYDPDDLVFALSQIAGVEVEDLRHLVSRPTSAGCDPLDVAVSLVESTGADELATALISGVSAALNCEWCTMSERRSNAVKVLAKIGNAPSAAWLDEFVIDAEDLPCRAGAGLVGPRDIAWAPLPSSDLVLVAGRDGPPFRRREREQLHQLSRIADARWLELTSADTGSVSPFENVGGE
jgi:hypothetical protein